MLKKTTLLLIFLLSISNPIISQIDKEVQFTSGQNELHGILTLPNNTSKKFPAIVILHGSDRGGIEDYRQFTDELIKSGFAILTYDSPGKGKSTGKTNGESFEYRTQEAIAAIECLQSRHDIKSNAVGLWGVSQGGWICQSAAATSDKVAFIIPVSGPGVTVTDQEIHRIRSFSKNDGFSKKEIQKAVLIKRLFTDLVLTEPQYMKINTREAKKLGTGPWNALIDLTYPKNGDDVKDHLKTLYKTLKTINDQKWAKHLMIGQMLPMFENITPEVWGVLKKSAVLTLEFNPAYYLSKVNVPVLAIFGEADATVPVKESVKLYKKYLKNNKRVTIKVFPKASHGINVDGKPAPGFYPMMINWLKALKL